jgi:hypothetical protein
MHNNWTAAEFNNTNRTAVVDAHWGELKKNDAGTKHWY